MSDKKSKRQQMKEEILKARKITAIRNTKASGMLVEKGQVFNVPSQEMTIDDALELVLIGKAEIGKVDVPKTGENAKAKSDAKAK